MKTARPLTLAMAAMYALTITVLYASAMFALLASGCGPVQVKPLPKPVTFSSAPIA